MKIQNLSNTFTQFFNENNNEPTPYDIVITKTWVLGREGTNRDYPLLASICPTLKGFYNWHTHVRHGIKATIIKEGGLIRLQDDLNIFDELVLKFYEEEVDVKVIDSSNTTYYAKQCLEFVYQALFESENFHLIKYMPSCEMTKQQPVSDDIECEEQSNEQWIYIFRHPRVKDELKIGMTERHWKERYAEANSHTYISSDLEVVATFPCKNCRAVEKLIHTHFEEYRMPVKSGQKRMPEWFKFPEDKVEDVVKRISSFMEALDILDI